MTLNLFSEAWAERDLFRSTSLSLALDRPRSSAHAKEISKLISPRGLSMIHRL